jgi:ribosomal protein S12 methylthiotransferase accessory factor
MVNGIASRAPDLRSYRAVAAELTWARIASLTPAFGITRVADVTGLDELGIPVYLAVRPTARTLSVSQGKGVTPLLSKISAVMEAIETWHAEHPCLAPVTTGPARAVLDSYDVRALPLVERSLVSDALVLDWVTGDGLVTGAPHPVPLAALRLDARLDPGWDAALFEFTSNGLASGNTDTEAKLHGLLELVERDCTTELSRTPLAARRYADPRTASAVAVHAVLDAFAAARCWLEVCDATNDLGVPCYVAYTWADDLPVMFAGAGCHPDAAVALVRALTEAAQSRLTFISGTRDDFAYDIYRGSRDLAATPPASQTATVPIPASPDPPPTPDEMVARVARGVAARTGAEPFAVELSRAEFGIPVWRVFAPGLRYSGRHEVDRG